MQTLESLQGLLELDFLSSHPVFHKQGLGAMGLGGLLVGLLMGGSLATSALIPLSYLLIKTSIPDSLLFSLWQWSNYILLLSLFHCLEFMITAIKQPRHLSYDSFIINHSPQYTLAFILCAFEYWIEILTIGQLKFRYRWIPVIGFILMVMGQTIRSIAMW